MKAETGSTGESDPNTAPGTYPPTGKRLAPPAELPNGNRFELGSCKNAFDPSDCGLGEMRIARGPHVFARNDEPRTV